MTYGEYYVDGVSLKERRKREWADLHQQHETFLITQSDMGYCTECGGDLVVDYEKCETICEKCGLIQGAVEYKAGLKWKHGGF